MKALISPIDDNLVSACPFSCCQNVYKYTEKLCASGQICSNNACVTPSPTKCTVGTPGNTASRDLNVGETVCARNGYTIATCRSDGTMLNKYIYVYVDDTKDANENLLVQTSLFQPIPRLYEDYEQDSFNTNWKYFICTRIE